MKIYDKLWTGILMISVMFGIFLAAPKVQAAELTNDSYCYAITPELTTAAYQYLNDIYVDRYPTFGTEFLYGSEADQAVLQKLNQAVTSGISGKKEQAEAIAKWVKRNIKYDTDTSQFPIDVFYNRAGDCQGYALLMAQLMRMSGIPAVPCSGWRGDMAGVLKLGTYSNMTGHAWVMAYLDGDWYLYDPLFDVCACADQDFIAKWYFINYMDGITPWYEGIPYDYINVNQDGASYFYIDNRFMYYVKGMPATDYYKSSVQPFLQADAISYNAVLRCDGSYGNGQDGYEYLEDPTKKNSMINSELYTDGWLKKGIYVRKNGMLAVNTILERDGTAYYFRAGSSEGRILPEDSSHYTMVNGYAAVQTGTTFSAFQTEYTRSLDDGYQITFTSETPDSAEVNPDGSITAKSAGFGSVFEKVVRIEDNASISSSWIRFMVVDSLERRADYTDHPSTEENPDQTGGGESSSTEEKPGQTGGEENSGSDSAASEKAPAPAQVTGLNLKNAKTTSMKASFKKISGADGYQVLLSADKNFKSGNKKYTATGTTVSLTGLKKGKTYYVKVRAYIKSSAGTVYGEYSKTAKLATISVGKVKSVRAKNVSGKKISAKLSSVKGAKGYEVTVASNKKFTKNKNTVRSAKKNLTVKKLKKGKTYYVRARAYKLNAQKERVYGAWSKTVKIKIRR